MTHLEELHQYERAQWDHERRMLVEVLRDVYNDLKTTREKLAVAEKNIDAAAETISQATAIIEASKRFDSTG